MEKPTMTRYIVLVVLQFLFGLSESGQPTYQVSLYSNFDSIRSPLYICNGAIIQSRLIITSASCLYYYAAREDAPTAMAPAMLSVLAGSTDAHHDILTLAVQQIFIPHIFNITTMENDFAILYLREPLPLDLRTDIDWIMLGNGVYETEVCLANFYSTNRNNVGFTHSVQLDVFAASQCGALTAYPAARQYDICSEYILPNGLDCKGTGAAIHPYNSDRGTGFVCNSHLVGILSTILQDDGYCAGEPVKAFYTNLAPYSNWIYSVIALAENANLEQRIEISSAPYHYQISSLVQSSVTEEPAVDTTESAMSTTSEGPVVRSIPTSAPEFIVSSASAVAQLPILIFGIALLSAIRTSLPPAYHKWE